MHDLTDHFWEQKTLEELSEPEWEALCDGCGRCCLQKLEDIDTAEIHFTSIACKLLDVDSCRCSNYPCRLTEVPDCTMVRPLTEEKCGWLPDTCAYKLLAQGRELLPWHPLLTGNPDSVHQAGISMRGIAVSERSIVDSDYSEYVITLHEC